MKRERAANGKKLGGWVGAALVLGASLSATAAPSKKEAAGGYSWDVPARWTEQPARTMRVATYAVPAAAGAEAGECAVFFFTGGDGGSVDANVDPAATVSAAKPDGEPLLASLGPIAPPKAAP